jgi:hypothetical protein
MKEREIRDRIARFLQKTARTVVVPASVGLGLSAAGCDRHSLNGRLVDGAADLLEHNSDALTNAPDLAAREDTVARDDLPQIAVPYVVAMLEDAAAGVAADALEVQSVDADGDASSSLPDVEPDIFYPPPAYLYLARALGEPSDAAGSNPSPSPSDGAQGTSPGPLAPPEKK